MLALLPYYNKTPLYLLLLLPLLFIGCNSTGEANLEVTYLKDDRRNTKNYQCRGQGCDLLNGIIWREVRPGDTCQEGYGGSDFVIVKGDLNGTEVSSEFKRTNTCEAARFDSLRPFLNYLELWSGGEKRGGESFASLLQLKKISQETSNRFPILGIHASNVLILEHVKMLGVN